ncbi:MAG: ATP-binding protein [Candidatus Aminicenantes bacterium]|nr:ATP-binding protein [Candidatus Aminicenantes bacterium]
MSNFYLDSIRDSQKGYIDDPWVFLRELAQNSRDSGALEIKIDPGGHGSDNEVIIFSDNGKGMTYREAEKYLFRLYSSSKFKERTSVGMYGVGFWTIMKFEPDEIMVESYSEEEDKWAVILDGNLNHRSAECKLGKFGTRVTLIRKRVYSDHESFCMELEAGVRRYCRFIDRKAEKGKLLHVIFRGKLISESLKHDDGISLKYGGRNFEGVVGLGDVPKVSLLTGGIPAWEGSTLDELSLVNNEGKDKSDYMKSGIAPVFHINGRNLRVNMSRRELIDDNSLRDVLKSSRKALNDLVQICSDHAYPRTRKKKVWYGLRKIYKDITSSYWKIIMAVLILVIPLEIFLLNKFLPAKGGEVITPDVVNVEGYRQYSATVDKLGEGVIADIRYSPHENIWMKMFTAPDFDRVRGFIWDGSPRYISLVAEPVESEDNFRINIYIRNGGDVFLPHPSGYRIDKGSIRISGVNKVKLKKSVSGEVIVNIPGYNKTLEYSCSIQKDRDDPGYQKKYLDIPGEVRFPDEVESRISELFYQNMENKISKSIRLVNMLVDYDISDGTAGYYKNYRKNDKWLKKVLEIGAGDCDVINGVLCLILRKSGVRSKLVVGLIGEKGFVLPQLHSWVEYYENGWKIADATAFSKIRSNNTGPGSGLSFINIDKNANVDKGDKILYLLLKMFLLLFLLSVFPLILFYREKLAKEKERKEKLNPRNKVKARRDVIEIGKSYLLAPELWNYNFDIVEQEIITTISGKNISIKKGIRLLKQRKLFLGKTGNPLVDELKRSDEIIIDSDNSIQHSLIRLFYGIVDLGWIRGLELDLENVNGSELSTGFIGDVNKVLEKLPWKDLSCLSAGNLDLHAFRDIDLSIISYRKFFRKTGYPKRFIALNMKSPEISAILELYENNRDLTMYRFFKMIMEKSLFFYTDRNISFVKVLRTILKNG